MGGQGFIECRGLHKSFGGRAVLEGVDLTVRRGETLVILGGSGSGKTVLLKHMNGLIAPESGGVFVDGQEISPLNDDELRGVRKKVGMVFQGSALFDSMTVEENIAYPLREHATLSRDEVAKRVGELLAVVDLEGAADLFPAELSGGMKKRAALARALALNPEALLYDEPTTGLDPLMTRRINELVRDLQEKLGLTSVVVTHDLDTAFSVGDRLAFLFEGRIRVVAPKEDFRAAGDPALRDFLVRDR
jgi:phospholipid/cholesterol/gamma-HCH transport system ATP-binding protein